MWPYSVVLTGWSILYALDILNESPSGTHAERTRWLEYWYAKHQCQCKNCETPVWQIPLPFNEYIGSRLAFFCHRQRQNPYLKIHLLLRLGRVWFPVRPSSRQSLEFCSYMNPGPKVLQMSNFYLLWTASHRTLQTFGFRMVHFLGYKMEFQSATTLLHAAILSSPSAKIWRTFRTPFLFQGVLDMSQKGGSKVST